MGIDFRRPKYVTGFRWGEALIWAANESGGGGIPTLISGIPPLTLSDALAKALAGLVQYGKTEQSETPTPTSPVNIACNNGTLIWKDRELPAGYFLLAAIARSGAAGRRTGALCGRSIGNPAQKAGSRIPRPAIFFSDREAAAFLTESPTVLQRGKPEAA